MKYVIPLMFFFCTCSVFSQYKNGSIDFGAGVLISIGLQEEVGFDIRMQYTSSTKQKIYIAEYNRFFIKEFEAIRIYKEFGITYNLRLFNWEPLTLTGGIGYLANDYDVLRRAEDTYNIFFSTGRFNHGAVLKFRGVYDISSPIDMFAELNFKSFGKRYDTFVIGLTYSLGL